MLCTEGCQQGCLLGTLLFCLSVVDLVAEVAARHPSVQVVGFADDYRFVGPADIAMIALVLGSPARHVGWVSRAGEILGDDLICPRTGIAYMENNGELIEK